VLLQTLLLGVSILSRSCGIAQSRALPNTIWASHLECGLQGPIIMDLSNDIHASGVGDIHTSLGCRQHQACWGNSRGQSVVVGTRAGWCVVPVCPTHGLEAPKQYNLHRCCSVQDVPSPPTPATTPPTPRPATEVPIHTDTHFTDHPLWPTWVLERPPRPTCHIICS
jgi:hypothetical protein